MSRLYYKRESKRPRRTLFGGLVSGVILLCSIVAAAALLLTLLAPVVRPDVSWVFPILGLVAPVVYIINLVLALYWIIRWRLLYAIPMVLLLLFGLRSIPLFVNLEFTKDYELESTKGAFRVMSYNIRGFINDDKQWSTEQMAIYLEEQDPDIICLQEYNPEAKHLSQEMGERFSKYSKAQFNSLAIYSRYPILRKENIFKRDTNESRRAMWVDLVIREDTIRVFNTHLHSTTIKAADDEYLTSRQVVQDTLRRDKIQDIISRYQHGSVERMKQVDTIAMVIANSPYATLVFGDFNDTPISYSYNKMSKGLKDTFAQSGKGYSHTYRGFNNTLRIDYILVGEGLTSHSYQIDEESTLSDHLPVMALIKIDKHK